MSNRFFAVRIELGNAAFDGYEPEEVARILDNAATRIKDSGHLYDGELYDINGNHVGQFYVGTE